MVKTALAMDPEPEEPEEPITESQQTVIGGSNFVPFVVTNSGNASGYTVAANGLVWTHGNVQTVQLSTYPYPYIYTYPYGYGYTYPYRYPYNVPATYPVPTREGVIVITVETEAKEKPKHLRIKIDASLLAQLSHRATEDDRSEEQVIRRAIKQYLAGGID